MHNIFIPKGSCFPCFALFHIEKHFWLWDKQALDIELETWYIASTKSYNIKIRWLASLDFSYEGFLDSF